MKKYIIFLLISFVLVSCYEEITDSPVGNSPPNTGLFLYPDSTISSQPSRLRISWWGDDPDGVIVGFYFTWDGINWSFTASNDSLFALQIGETDINYTFKVSAVDDGGNGMYDAQVFQNNINYGPEPFIDANNNGSYDSGEKFFDIGLIDPTPAEIDFPIKNSSPSIFWNELSFLPDTSYAVMSFGWEAEDIDGNESIININVALNDTSDTLNIVSLDGAVRRITLRLSEGSTSLMDILIDGNPNNIASEKLPGIVLNGDNKLFVQAVDISGAKSSFISLPGEDETWYVKNSGGKILIVDDYRTSDNSAAFYSAIFDSIGLTGFYDIYDIHNQLPPYLNVTFLETIKLYDYIFWYTDNNPSLDLAASSTQKFIDAGGRIFYSMQFSQSIDLTLIQAFLPINADSSDYEPSVLGGVEVSAQLTDPSYPDLQTTLSIFRVRSFYLPQLGALPIYYFPNNVLNGHIGFTDNQKRIFFIGLPLHRMNGGEANVKDLFNKVLFNDFGLTL